MPKVIGSQFELHAYPADADGNVATQAEVTTVSGSDSSARGKAGRLAKQIKGPVDLAYAGDADWADRYLTTAIHSDYHAKGYQFERIGN